MALEITEVEAIPQQSYRSGPRKSKCLEVVTRARNAETGKVAVTGSSPDELNKFYKALVQWRGRNKAEDVRVQKTGDKVFVWIER